MNTFFIRSIIVFIAFISPVFGQISYPSTRVVAQSATFFGVEVPEPYSWLEDLKSKEVLDWRDSQNALTSKYLEEAPATREKIRKVMSKLTTVPAISIPDVVGRRGVWLTLSPGANQKRLLTKLIGSDEEKVLFDPNKESPDGSLSMSYFGVSPDAKMVAFRVRKKGTQEFTMYVKSIEDDKTFYTIPNPSRTPGTASVGWVNGHSGFYYVKEVQASSSLNSNKSGGLHAIYYHSVGTKPENDIAIYGGDAHPTWKYGITASDDGNWLIVSVWEKSALTNGVIVIPLSPNGVADIANAVRVGMEFDAKNTPLDMHNGKLWLYTNNNASNYRLVSVDLERPVSSSWFDVLPEKSYLLAQAMAINGRIFAEYSIDASPEAFLYDETGKLVKKVDLPGIGTLGYFVKDYQNSKAFFNYSSMVTPKSIYTMNFLTGQVELFEAGVSPFDMSKYTVTKEMVKSRDGTRVPVFIAHKKGVKLDGTSPMSLWGYGGFNISVGSSYVNRGVAFLELGGSVAYASIRGGGEYGESWHKAGMLLNKKNSFNDFVDIAQYLVDRKYTSPKRLAIIGESTGGLLTGAAVNQRPDLFGAVVSMVGPMDMIHLESSATIFDWTDEFGTVKKKDDFQNLLSYSPLHNIRRNVGYPPILVTTAELDDRVIPSQQLKYIAALQNSNLGHSPKLLSVQYGVGHTFGRSTKAILDENTDTFTFVARSLEMDLTAVGH